MSDVKVDPAQVEQDAVVVGAQVVANPRGFWRSKTFWFNVITAALHYTGIIPAPYVVPVAVGGNVALRLISSGVVSITGK